MNRMQVAVVAGMVLTGQLLFAVAAEPEKPASPAAAGSIFRPGDFKSLGRLAVPAEGTVTFNTGDETNAPAVSGAAVGAGQLGLSKSGKAQLAVFCFDGIVLSAGAKVNVTGNRGLVLLSKATAVIDATVDLSGKPGVAKAVAGAGPDGTFRHVWAEGGPGGDSGERGKSTQSAPPSSAHGCGGPGMKDTGRAGYGFGAGQNYRVQGGVAGSGAGYGGAGGDTSEGSESRDRPQGLRGPQPLPGGVTYGDAALTDLFGGSGGAGGSNDRSFSSAGGGGGGGGLAIIALKSITLGAKGRLLAAGAAGGKHRTCGGGGSGGAILLTAPAITLRDGAVVDASGGTGGDAGPGVAEWIKPGIGRRDLGSGGGGGGGRIAFYAANDFGAAGKNREEKTLPKGVSVAGGKGGTMAKDGAAGTFYDGSPPGLR